MQPHCYISVNHLVSYISSFPVVGFSGSRNPYSHASISVSVLLPKLSGYSGVVGVGCAKGVDNLVRSYFPQARVFKVQSPINRKAFALRSTRLINWLVASSGLLLAFPSTSCPAGVTPSLRFNGYGSGTWGSVALAIGMGAPVLLYVHFSLGIAFPSHQALACHFKLLGFSFGGYWWLAG